MVENGEKLSITNSLTLYLVYPLPTLPLPTWFSNFCFFTEKQIKTTVWKKKKEKKKKKKPYKLQTFYPLKKHLERQVQFKKVVSKGSSL